MPLDREIPLNNTQNIIYMCIYIQNFFNEIKNIFKLLILKYS